MILQQKENREKQCNLILCLKHLSTLFFVFYNQERCDTTSQRDINQFLFKLTLMNIFSGSMNRKYFRHNLSSTIRRSGAK